jgi:hypothetical protein
VTSDESTNFWVDAPYNDRIPSLSPYRQYSTVRLSFPRPDEFSRLGIDAALAEIVNGRGKLFDPAVVDACVALVHSGRMHLETTWESTG